MEKTVGTCSICGGRVTVPSNWMGIYPPTPTCQNCGARAAQNNGPVIPMKPVQLPHIPRPNGRLSVDSEESVDMAELNCGLKW